MGAALHKEAVTIVGHGHTMGEPASGLHGRGWELRHGRFARAACCDRITRSTAEPDPGA